ncbi:MAG: hypothetical protein F4123_03380 [Gemmatimonadetes bacterium]|nr:hypothetical protein [Gemmatimonadota bacterium]MYB98642.1 hypothetical protein [Gemmatimonadota bacterium]MYI45428.1 hypothetical protein [Gemmatimonadota bacterium]
MATSRPLPILLILGLHACGGDTPVDPPVPTTITVTPSEVSFASVGDTEQLSARVFDQYGSAMANVRVQWSSIRPTVARVEIGSGLVTSAGNGTSTITARAGGAAGQASVTVEQVPTGIEAARGDGQEGFVNEPLPISPGARVLDANGNAAMDITVSFEVTSGGGSISETSDITGVDGIAETRWTMGADSVQTLLATAAGMSAEFTVTAVQRPVTILVDSLDWGRATVAYDYMLEARGGTNEGYVWSLGDGSALPPGLELSPGGVVHGTPAESGEFEFNVRVVDSSGEEDSADLGMHVCDGPLGLAVGDVRAFVPSGIGPCGLFVRAPEASAYYRVTFAGLDLSSDQFLSVQLAVEGASSGAAAGLRPVSGAQEPATADETPDQEVDWTDVLAIQQANEALHNQVRREEMELYRRLADEGRLGTMLDEAIAAQEARRAAPAGRSTPRTFRLYARGAGNNCVVDTTVVADVIAENDHLVVYEEVGTTVPVPVQNANRIIDFYSDHGAEVIERYFGGVSDVDNNGRITVLIDPTLTGVRAFVWSGDMTFTTTQCAASNEMELIHMSRGAFLLDNTQWAYSGMVHEAVHVSSLYKRVRSHHVRGRPPGARVFNPTWIEEGRAEIGKEMSSRIAWERAGGPALGTRVTGDMVRDGYRNLRAQVYGTFQIMARVVRAVSARPNAVTFEAGDDATVYGSGWHFHRFLRDRAMAGADEAQGADEALVLQLNDSLSMPGIEGIAGVTGDNSADLLAEFATAISVAGAENRLTDDAVPRFLHYDFPTATEVFSNPDPPGRYPWPVTITGNTDVDAQSSVDLAASRRYTGQVTSNGTRIYDFEASSAGAAAVFRFTGSGRVRMIIARVPKPPGF